MESIEALGSSSRLISDPLDANKHQSRSLVNSFYLLGIGALLPWNAILSSFDFFVALRPDNPPIQVLTNACTFPFMISGSVFIFTSTKHRNAVVWFSFLALAIISALLPIAAEHGLSGVVGLVALLGITSGLSQTTLYGTVNLFPGGEVVTAFNSGGGFASILIVGIRIATRLLSDDKDITLGSLLIGFRVFCSFCTVLCGACIVVFHRLYITDETYRECVSNGEERRFEIGEAWSTLKQIRIPAISCFLCFTTTMMIFPGILGRLPNGFGSVTDQFLSWYTLGVVALFAVGDTAGRMILSSRVASRYPDSLPALVLLKSLSVLVYLLVWTGAIRCSLLAVLSLVFVLGFLNGFVMNIAFIIAPSFTDRDRVEVAGRLMFLMLIYGLFAGSSSGWVVELAFKKLGWL